MVGLGQSLETIAPAYQGDTEEVTTNINWKTKEFVDANVVVDGHTEKQKGGWDTVTTDPELPKDQAKTLSNEILGKPETKDQVDQLKNLWEKYKNWELKDIQQKQYEDLMTTIREQLDRDVPTVIEMNKEININYYMKHPDEAKKFSDEIVNNYENMDNVQLVYNVVSRREYLWKDSKQKLDTVINNVINNLDEDAKAILKGENKENHN